MKKDKELPLHKIIESIELIEKYVKNIDFDEFKLNQKTQDAVIYRLEVVSEIINHFAQDIRNMCSKINWPVWADLRTVLLRYYYEVLANEIWILIKKDIPKLKQSIQKILKDLEKEK